MARSHGEGVGDRLFAGYAIIGVEVIMFAWLALKARTPLAQAGDLLILAGLARMIWRIRLRRPGRLPDASASAGTLIAFHRAELERQRHSYVSLMVTSDPAIAGLLVTVFGQWEIRRSQPASWLATFFSLLAFWFITAWLVQRRRARRRHQQEDLGRMARNSAGFRKSVGRSCEKIQLFQRVRKLQRFHARGSANGRWRTKQGCVGYPTTPCLAPAVRHVGEDVLIG